MKQLYLGKQRMAGFTLLVRPETETLRCPSVGIVKSATSWRVSPSRSAFEMLERYAMKVARTVLRGGSDSNATPLPDQLPVGTSRVFGHFRGLESVPPNQRCPVSPTCGQRRPLACFIVKSYGSQNTIFTI